MILPNPGSSQYMPTLMRTLLENPALEEWQFDPNVFSLLLLSLIVKRGGIILDLPSGSTGRDGQDRAVRCVVTIAESIFGLQTRCIHLDPALHPSKLVKVLQSPRSRRRYARKGDASRRRPALNFTQPEGTATRYHSAETQLAASRRTSYTTVPAIDVSTIDIAVPDINAEGPDPGTRTAEDGDGGRVPTWPDILVVTGMEDCDSPLQIKICDLVKQSRVESSDGVGMMVIWIRDEEKAEKAPAWLIDTFVLSGLLNMADGDYSEPPQLPVQALIPSSASLNSSSIWLGRSADVQYLHDLSALLPYTHIHPSLTQNLNNLISATSTHPNLHSAMTAHFFTTLPVLVKAHRLLSAPYDLPDKWRVNLAKVSLPSRRKSQRSGLHGGKCGVDNWPKKAGEEPNMADLGEGAQGWYVGPGNVQGVWASAVRHRVKWRPGSESIMWAIKSSAADLGEKGVLSESRARRKGAKRRAEVDRIVDEMLEIM